MGEDSGYGALHDDGRNTAAASAGATEVRSLAQALAADEPVHRTLAGNGVLHVDRALPFVVVYRAAPGDSGTRALPSTEASYLVVGDGAGAEAEARGVISELAAEAVTRFGAFLVIELWTEPAEPAAFVIRGPAREAGSTLRVLAEALRALPVPVPVAVRIDPAADRHPPGREPLLDVRSAWRQGILHLGLSMPPVFRDPAGDVYPVFLRRFRAAFSRALRVAIADFARVQTVAPVESYRALGPRVVGQLAWRADAELAAIEQRFDFLLLVAPMDAADAFDRFEASGCDRLPDFHYRLLPFDPDLLKRQLYAIELEQVEDPALAQLLREKREELDRQISLLGARGTAAFRHGSQALYGSAGPGLVRTARDILAATADGRSTELHEPVSAMAFAEHAQREIEAYREQLPGLVVDTQIRPDVTGLMVSSGRLLIGERLSLAPERVDALLHHEVGTHVLTYVNGAAQPLRQLRHGLAGYDELQEALGVLAEYLVGGLTRTRLRTLAARVMAAESVEQGAEFMDTFRLLHHEHGFTHAAAFDVSERVHQSGGFTRDVIYLRGIVWLLEHLRHGCPLEELYIGKLAAGHTEVVAELRERGVLKAPPLRPRFLERADVQQRLRALAEGGGMRRLLEEAA